MDVQEEDTGAMPATDEALRRLANTVRELRNADRAVAQLEADLKDAQAAQRHLSEVALPQLMAECDMIPPTKTVISGLPVVYDEKYRCGQLEFPAVSRRRANENDAPKSKDPAGAFRWLDEANHGDISKDQITVTLGKGSAEVAAEIMEVLRRHPASNTYELARKRIVLWNTLAAFCDEQVKHGADVPLDLLGVMRVKRVRIGAIKEE